MEETNPDEKPDETEETTEPSEEESEADINTPKNPDSSEEKTTNPEESTDNKANEKPAVTDPTPETPVTNEEGTVIVGVEKSKPIVQFADGTTQKVEASTIGATVQKNGTFAVKGNDGKMKVLPKTGETENIALSVLGGLLALGSSILLRKRI